MRKIALPVTQSNQIDDHFGHCDMYNVYSISDDNEIEKVQTVDSTKGCGCKSGISSVLAAEGVTVMLAGGIGNGAINVLKANGIEVVRGCRGDATAAVHSYLAGNLPDSGISCHQHEHRHRHVHQCNH